MTIAINIWVDTNLETLTVWKEKQGYYIIARISNNFGI